MKKIPIGRDNFKDIIEGDFYYVDKTKVIEEILDRGAYVTLFTRPRRFGKSLLISTINEFFNSEKKEENNNLFDGLYINNTKYKEEQGKYPIIKLNFKNFQSDNWKIMYQGIQEEMRQVFESKKYVLEVLDETEKSLYNKFLTHEANEQQYMQSIKILSQFMEKYWKQKVILLIDEYDVPIQNGYLNNFYNEIVTFIKTLFNNGLKTNDSIKFAIMTGVLRVSKESIFSDLNNVKIYSLLDEHYGEYFGFTESETKELLQYYGLDLTENVKKMYDGYIFGNTEIYNPWSIINYASDKKLWPYWVNTSGDELLKNIFDKTESETSGMVEKLLLGKSINCKYNEKITFLDLNYMERGEEQDTIANFLLVSGYLTKEKGAELTFNRNIRLKIPNAEVKTVFNDIIERWMRKKTYLPSYKLIELQQALENNEKEKIEEILNSALNNMSFVDSNESFYHGYVLGLFVNFLNVDYIVKSNREGGHGRFDIMIEKSDRSLGIILELKLARDDEDLEKKAELGKLQIKEKEYYKELELDKVENILTYAVAFKGKKCKVM